MENVCVPLEPQKSTGLAKIHQFVLMVKLGRQALVVLLLVLLGFSGTQLLVFNMSRLALSIRTGMA